MNAEEIVGTAGVARRAVSSGESERASRAWWDADAADYLDEHAADIGETAFVWCPENLREDDARLLGDPAELAGTRVLEVGCGSAPCSRWLARPGRPCRSRWTCPARCCATPPGRARRSGIDVPLVQAGAERLPFADASFDLACSAFGARPVRGRARAGDARGGPRAAPRRPVRVRRQPPGALGVPGRPRTRRADRRTVLFRPHALPGGRRVRRGHLRRAPPHARRPGARRRRRRSGARGPGGAGVAGGTRADLGPVVSAARASAARHRDLRDAGVRGGLTPRRPPRSPGRSGPRGSSRQSLHTAPDSDGSAVSCATTRRTFASTAAATSAAGLGPVAHAHRDDVGDQRPERHRVGRRGRLRRPTPPP